MAAIIAIELRGSDESADEEAAKVVKKPKVTSRKKGSKTRSRPTSLLTRNAFDPLTVEGSNDGNLTLTHLQYRLHCMHPHNVTLRYTNLQTACTHTMAHWDTHTYNIDYTTCTLTRSLWDTHLQFRLHHMHPHNVTLRYTPTIAHRDTHLPFRFHHMHPHNVTLR